MYTNMEMAARKRVRDAAPARTPQAATGGVEQAREAYLAAWRWRRRVEAALRDVGLTFTQWLVLDAAERAVEAQRDAVNQSDVSRTTELDRMTVSQVMRSLSELGMVDRGPSASGPAYRIFLTRKGKHALREAQASIGAASE
jgi:DNA-binding MarR family transcriptional regulator